MKKTLMVVGIVVLALGILGAGVAFAQGQQPPRFSEGYNDGTFMGGRGMMGGRGSNGFVHEYVEQALAEKLDLTEEQVEDAFANGTSMYQLVLDNGVAEADLPTFINEVHQTAFDKAVTDGVMTQEQADWMLERMQGMYAEGSEFGGCLMGGEYSQDGTGFRGGMRGGRSAAGWQQMHP